MRTLKWYFPCVNEARRLRGVVLESLDQKQDAKSLARHAYRSRTQFYRLFRAMIEETPVAVAGKGRMAAKGACQAMDLFDIFTGQESWHTRRLLNLAGTLTDEQLDRPLQEQVKIFPWDGPDQSLRQILDRMVLTKEVWAAALTGAGMPPTDNALPEDRTPSAMLARMEEADAAFHGVLTDVHNRSAWDDTFVDALCEPPEAFTFGGTFAHVITFNFYRRMLAIDALRRLGVTVEGFGCPEEYLASRART